MRADMSKQPGPLESAKEGGDLGDVSGTGNLGIRAVGAQDTDANAPAGPFDEARAVGRLPPVTLGKRERPPEKGSPEDLGRLRVPERCAVRRFDDDPPSHALDRVRRGLGNYGRAAPGGQSNSSTNRARGHERARRVMHGDDIDIRRHCGEGAGHRVLAPPSAPNDRDGRAARDPAREFAFQTRWNGQDDVADRRHSAKSDKGMQKERASAEGQQRLGARAFHAAPPPGCQKNRAGFHGSPVL